MRAHVRQGLFKSDFDFFGGYLLRNLRSHVVEMLFKLFRGPAMLEVKHAFEDIGKIALRGHAGGPRLCFKRGGILL